MAQVLKLYARNMSHALLEASNVLTVPQAGNTNLLTLPCTDLEYLYLQIINTGFAFDAFRLLGKWHKDMTAQLLASAAGDFTGPVGIVLGASGDLTTLGVATGWCKVNVTGLSELQVEASSGNASGTGTTIYAGGN